MDTLTKVFISQQIFRTINSIRHHSNTDYTLSPILTYPHLFYVIYIMPLHFYPCIISMRSNFTTTAETSAAAAKQNTHICWLLFVIRQTTRCFYHYTNRPFFSLYYTEKKTTNNQHSIERQSKKKMPYSEHSRNEQTKRIKFANKLQR